MEGERTFQGKVIENEKEFMIDLGNRLHSIIARSENLPKGFAPILLHGTFQGLMDRLKRMKEHILEKKDRSAIDYHFLKIHNLLVDYNNFSKNIIETQFGLRSLFIYLFEKIQAILEDPSKKMILSGEYGLNDSPLENNIDLLKDLQLRIDHALKELKQPEIAKNPLQYCAGFFNSFGFRLIRARSRIDQEKMSSDIEHEIISLAQEFLGLKDTIPPFGEQISNRNRKKYEKRFVKTLHSMKNRIESFIN